MKPPLDKLRRVMAENKWLNHVVFYVWGHGIYATAYFDCRSAGFSSHTARDLIKADHLPSDTTMRAEYITNQTSGCNWPNVGYTTGLDHVPCDTKKMIALFRGKCNYLKEKVLEYDAWLHMERLRDRVNKKEKR